MKKDILELLSHWKGRLRGSFLDLAILYMAAFSSETLYPYSVKKNLEEKWGELSPPLPTIYSTIDRLEKKNLIESKADVDGPRIKKILVIKEDGWIALEKMMEELKQFLNVFEHHEEDVLFPKFLKR
ncbi:MAG: PadR family transcriptional regulator [Candidatus Heimdallarchaeota archaeon]|nr:PadR family transcriptional regulator [Candidatus Heimdallarchaeota archaeon]